MHNKVKKNLKKIIALLLIVCLSYTAYSFYNKSNDHLVGLAQSVLYPHMSEVTGKILEMPIELGQQVTEGDLLAVIDNTDETYALAQLKLNLEKEKLNLADARTGGSGSASQEVALASASYESASVAQAQAVKDYEDALVLYEAGALPLKSLESAKLEADTATYTANAAKAKLALVSVSTPASAQTIDVAQLELQIKQAEENLEKYTIRAQKSGIIVSKSYVSGDMVSKGTTLTEIGAIDEGYLTFYMPEEGLAEIAYGDTLLFSYRGKKYEGTIIFIDVKKQYTPKEQQTTASKNKESFKVKLSIPEGCPIKSGETAEIMI